MDEHTTFTVVAPEGTCPECGTHLGEGEDLDRHLERHTGAARDSEDAGGVVPEEQQADNGAGRVQTE